MRIASLIRCYPARSSSSCGESKRPTAARELRCMQVLTTAHAMVHARAHHGAMPAAQVLVATGVKVQYVVEGATLPDGTLVRWMDDATDCH